MRIARYFIAGTGMLALASVASAGEMMTLSDAELDGVTAAGARVSASLTGDAIVDGSFFLDNLPGVFSVAEIRADITPFNDATVVLEASADTFD